MNVIEAIHARRSVRKFKTGKIAPGQVDALLRAAMAAPSAHNGQPWRFVVVDDPMMLSRIADNNQYAAMAEKAPLAILACADRDVPTDGFWVQDCSAAIQNMLLAAVELGLGAVWTGIYPVDSKVAAFKHAFALPAGIVPLAAVIFGIPASAPKPADRYDPGKVHRNRWGEQY